MSVTGGVKDAAVERPPSWRRWFAANVAQALAAVVRAPRVKTKPMWRAYARLAVGALAAVVVIAAAMIFVDAWAIEAARRLPRWLVDIFEELTDFGKSGWLLWPIGIALAAIAVFASPAVPRFAQLVLATMAVRLGFLFAAIAVPGLFSAIVKRLIGRARPFVGGEADPFLFMTFVWRPDYASLPSGHATTAFAALVAVGAIWPHLRAIMWAYALIIALSRVIVLAHHPSDVVAGALVGVLGALLVRDWFASRRLGFVIKPDGRVRTLPGPSLRRARKVAVRLAGA